MSSLISPPSTILTGGSGIDSQNTSVAATDQLPGDTPPRSTWWATAPVQQNSSPSTNSGANRLTSFWCSPPPTHGSLHRNMSPSPMPGRAARWRSVQLTAMSSDAASSVLYRPTWTTSPTSSMMAASKSLQSVTTTEPDMRLSASPISSVMEVRRCRMTS